MESMATKDKQIAEVELEHKKSHEQNKKLQHEISIMKEERLGLSDIKKIISEKVCSKKTGCQD